MALRRFDVVRSRARDELYVVYQSDFLEHLSTRLVIPLVPSSDDVGATLRLNPVIEVDGTPHILATHLCFAAEIAGLRPTDLSLEEHQDSIRDALDFLTLGF